MIYKLYKTDVDGAINAVMTIDQKPEKSFIIDTNNEDYIKFKLDLEGEATLQGISGNVLSDSVVASILSQLDSGATTLLADEENE
tara:strand:+ start:220 stop:474 length:255 start_codon:yes stop_codon:yes gene_type:complete